MERYVSEYEKSLKESNEIEKEFYVILKEIELNTDIPYEKIERLKKLFIEYGEVSFDMGIESV